MTETGALDLPEDRYFDPEPAQRRVALEIYAHTKGLPLICPHGHVDPRVFSDPDYRFGSPADLLIIPDHYIFRMLYSQGVPLEKLGIPAPNGRAVEFDHRAIWQTFADHYYLFRGTPTGMWLKDELHEVFGIRQKLNAATAQAIYDEIEHKLTLPEFRPRRLYERFNIEALCTTDPAISDLRHHKAIRDSGWSGRIVPTFRPDAVVNLDTPNWRDHIQALRSVTNIDISGYRDFIAALEQQRAAFKQLGATATDHAASSAYTAEVSPAEADEIFQRGLNGQATADDAARFTGHMLMEMARMSVEDGLVMQLHSGSFRNHNQPLHALFGTDMGADIPVSGEFTRSLRPLLDKFGNERSFTLILFTLDETTFSRELAPLAGHYPAVRIGPPWWFYDSWNGMTRYREAVGETAGLYNTVGFNDDTRAYPSIPARHDLARRVDANWLANLVVRHIIDMDEAVEMAHAAAYSLAKAAYRLG